MGRYRLPAQCLARCVLRAMDCAFRVCRIAGVCTCTCACSCACAGWCAVRFGGVGGRRTVVYRSVVCAPPAVYTPFPWGEAYRPSSIYPTGLRLLIKSIKLCISIPSQTLLLLDVTGSPRLVTLRPRGRPRGWPRGRGIPLGSRSVVERLSTQRARAYHGRQRVHQRPRTLSRYNTRLSERYSTHHGSTGFPPGTAGEPSRYAGEEQGERDSESGP